MGWVFIDCHLQSLGVKGGKKSKVDGLTQSKSHLDGDEDDSGRQSNTSGRVWSRQSGSRPGSTLGSRPGSSLRKLGSRGSERRERMRRNIGVEVNAIKYSTFTMLVVIIQKTSQSGKKYKGKGHGEDGDSDDGEAGGKRSRRRTGHRDGSEDDNKGRSDFKFSSGRMEEDEEKEEGSRANL